MKKRITRFLLPILLFMFYHTGFGVLKVWAASTMSTQVDKANKQIVVSGVIDTHLSKQKVLLIVTRPGKSINDVKSGLDTDIGDVVAHMAQVLTETGGTYSYRFTLDSKECDTGYYSVKATGNNFTAAQGQFYFANDNAEQVALQSVNNARTVEELKSIFEGSSHSISNLGLDNDSNLLMYNLYAGLSGTDKTKVYEILLVNKVTYQNTIAFTQDFNRAAALTVVNIARTAQEIQASLSNISGTLGIQMSGPYTTVLKNDHTDRLEVCSNLVGKNFTKVDAVQKAFNGAITVTALKSITDWHDMQETLVKLAAGIDGFVLDMSESSNFGGLDEDDQAEVYKEITKKAAEITDTDKLLSIFNAAVKNVKPVVGNDSGTSGGKSGSKGGTAISNSAPVLPAPVPTETDFTDLGEFPWAVESVKILNQKGAIKGFEDGTFRPSDYITREQFVKMLIITFGLENLSAKADFSDIKTEDWYFPYISSAYDAGILNGMEDGSFGVGKRITRQEMAVMADRTLKKVGITLEDKIAQQAFADQNDIAAYAVESVETMQKAGIINGVEDGRFAPLDGATRAEAAKLLYGLLKHRTNQ